MPQKHRWVFRTRGRAGKLHFLAGSLKVKCHYCSDDRRACSRRGNITSDKHDCGCGK